MRWIIAILILYVIPCYYSYKFTQKAHSIGGRWDILNPTISDLMFMILPLFNIVVAIEYMIGDYKPLRDREQSREWLAEFFHTTK